jgi:hypothetical protein
MPFLQCNRSLCGPIPPHIPPFYMYIPQSSPASYIAQPHTYLPIIGLTQDKLHTVLTLSSYIPSASSTSIALPIGKADVARCSLWGVA